MARVTVDIDLNRVEGDLEFQLDLENNVVVDARCIGTLYRGFEQLLIGRAPRDALVITPRVCGICGTAHMYAAVKALEQLANITPPVHAVHIRNLCLLVESLQSDIRQTFLFFTPDFCNPKYADHPKASTLAEAFAPLKGHVVKGALQTTRQLLGIVAVFGGQWPHSTYMLPGGVVQPANFRRILDSRDLLVQSRTWFETVVLGDTIDAFLGLESFPSLIEWMSARPSAALSLFSDFSRDIGLHEMGAGTGHLLSYGLNGTPDASSSALPPGFFNADTGLVEPLDHLQINEHVRHSWFLDYPGGRHPWDGETIPDFRKSDGRYTWAKAPRYGRKVVQTGPLAELRIAEDPLIVDCLSREGDNTWLRQFARLRRAAWIFKAAQETLARIEAEMHTPHYRDPGVDVWPDGDSFGLVEAARGALGHWLRVRDGAIEKYQIVTPTAWNASPQDAEGQHGHWEASIIGLSVPDPDNPVQIGHIVRSHDPCLVCTVHCVGSTKKLTINV